MALSRQVLNELENESVSPIHDPLWGHIYVPNYLLKIIKSPVFMRLAAIRQLGPTYLIYPGASHTRYNHSIGVLFVADKCIRSILIRDKSETFTIEGVKAFLCAALCHDLGHFPYTHSLKELPLLDHEILTSQIIENSLSDLIQAQGINPQQVCAIINKELIITDNETAHYRNFLSGVLDPDKIDYLQRDGYFCGLPFGRQDLDFTLRHLRFSEKYGLGIDKDGVRVIEHLLFSKYLLYRSVYWHPEVRIATGMIKKAVFAVLSQGLIKGEDLYGLTDGEFMNLFKPFEDGPAALASAVAAGQLFKVCAEIPLASQPDLEAPLMNLEKRNKAEIALAKILSTTFGCLIKHQDILIDIPEKISFEVDMPVYQDGGVVNYPDSNTVFSPELVGDFTRCLRLIRVAIAPNIYDNLRPEQLLRIPSILSQITLDTLNES